MSEKKKLSLEQMKEIAQKDKLFYLSLWGKSNKRCSVTDVYLGKEPLTMFFHHLLPKSRYPQYRWCEWNVVIISSLVHSQVELNISKVPEIEEKTNNLLQKHRNGELQEC